VKIASSRATVPPDVFTRDLHQPSVNTRASRGGGRRSITRSPT
jgi:hypothetical protein